MKGFIKKITQDSRPLSLGTFYDVHNSYYTCIIRWSCMSTNGQSCRWND